LEVGAKHGLHLLPEDVVNGAFALAVSIAVFIVVSLVTHRATEESSVELRGILDG